MVHSIDSLIEIMNPYKIKSDEIIPINFIMKNELDLYSDSETMREKVKQSQFISIIRGKPYTEIHRQTCMGKDSKGAIITVTNQIFVYNSNYIYKYSDETINIVQKWLYIDKLINDININLQRLDVEDLRKIRNYLLGVESLQTINLKDTMKYFKKIEKEI